MTDRVKWSLISDAAHSTSPLANRGFGKSVALGADGTLEALSKAVAEVYDRCGFEADASLTTLQMLGNVEAKLEEYLSLIEKMPAAYVEEAEKVS